MRCNALLLLLAAAPAAAQSPPQGTLDLNGFTRSQTDAGRFADWADRFFAEEDDYRAITFYKLALFSGTDDAESARVGAQIVRAYLRAGRYAEGAAEADALLARVSDGARPRLHALAGEGYLLARQPGFAQAAFEQAADGWSDGPERSRALLQAAYALAEQGRYADAAGAFARLEPDPAAAAARGVAERYREGPPRKSEALAVVLSIVPGGGQLYAGAYQEAALSLAVNAALGLLSYDGIRHATRTDFAGAVVWTSLASSFYFGNMYAAGVAARRANEAAVARARRELADAAFEPAFGTSPPDDWLH